MLTRVCTKCHERKPLSQFHKHSGVSKNGIVQAFRPDCKPCRNGYVRQGGQTMATVLTLEEHWDNEVELMTELAAAGKLERYVEATRANRVIDFVGKPITGPGDPFWERFDRAQLIASGLQLGRP